MISTHTSQAIIDIFTALIFWNVKITTTLCNYIYKILWLDEDEKF